MKWLGFSALLISNSIMANDLNEAQVKQLFEENKYVKIIEQVDDFAPYEVAKYKALSMARLEDFEDAIVLLDRRIAEIEPKDTEALAKEWMQKGNVFASQAMDASIFTAAGYAEDSLEAFKKAHKLMPDDLETNRALIGFYRNAPGFVGGDVEKAIDMSIALEKHYPFKAGVMITQGYLAANKSEKVEEKFKQMQQAYPKNHELALQASYFYDRQERYQDNHQHLVDALSWSEPEDEAQKNEWFMLHYALVKNSVKTKSNLENALVALNNFKKAPEKLISNYEQWPVLREAQIRLLMGQKKQAIALAKQARAASDDSKLRKKAKRIIKKGRI
ncbi:hypothetical protein JQC92_14200 [Shewanella sp. 202IG2-18]|uniref:tetratricopeptide repeat protein n=1 Tax=Parashewanella hymeniacidonis TaxID=2807618 RepID=UPI0019609E14|nr:hypothetical protein [Parashewanella hymeniacidonis]MBM7073164.1 hypothetical protein [Parashewanella hymeniacidonis]